MELLRDTARIEDSRKILIAWLNENGLDGHSILSIQRQADPCLFEPDEAVILQGKTQPYVYFMVVGVVAVYARIQKEYRELGERASVCVLGEISYFNGSVPSADVVVRGPESGIAFRLTYEQLDEIIGQYAGVKEMLNRIADTRRIDQNNGYAPFPDFLKSIGQKRKRYLLDRRIAPLLDRMVKKHLVPLVEAGKTLLDAGDGPGVIAEMILDYLPDAESQLHIQTGYMESVIADPFTPFPTDLSRARFLRASFGALAALQVFNSVPASRVMEQFRIARGLIDTGGTLVLIKARVVNISFAVGSAETHLFYELLEGLVDEAWPRLRGKNSLIQTVFLDADLDPLMGWNQRLQEKAGRKKGLEVPERIEGLSRKLLELLLDQASRAVFNPDAVQFEWLAGKAKGIGFTLTASEQEPDLGFFYQVFTRE